MNTQATSLATSDPLAAMLQNTIIDETKGNEFSTIARDMFEIVLNNDNFNKESAEHLAHESSDPINHLLKVIPLLLAEVRKNDQSRSTVGKTSTSGADVSDPDPPSRAQVVTTNHALEGDRVDAIDIVPSEPSSLPVVSIADRYTRSMLKCLAGYPLYEPQPYSRGELSKEYLLHGVNVGDVGFVRGDGVFDFLFNVCPSMNSSTNPSMLPDGFSLEPAECSATRAMSSLPHGTRHFQNPVTRTKSGEYICEGSEGAILELPEGAIQDEATNIRPFEKLAARHGVQWYEYTMTQGKKISNGSLYLITSFTKCAQWGMAVFDRSCPPGQGLRFDRKRLLPFGKSTSKYHWKGSRTFPSKVSDHNQGDVPNQCVFLRGYKIMIRQDIFDHLCNDQHRGTEVAMRSSSSQVESINLTRDRATRVRGGGWSDPMSKKLTDGGLLSWTKRSSMKKSNEVVLRPNFNSSPVHPSDLINAALLSQNPDAKVALTHDDFWCDLLRDNFPKLNYTRLINIARSYANMVDEYGGVFLGRTRIADSSNVIEESHCPLPGIEAPALRGPVISPDNDNTFLSAMIWMTLPRELVERIFLFLDTESMLACKLVSKEFNDIIQSSTVLRYFLACTAAGVIDNPRSPLSYAERLEALEKREDAWRKLKPVFETTIGGIHETAWASRSTEGVHFLSDDNLKDLNYCRLTSFPQDKPQLIKIPSHGPAFTWSGTVVNVSAALYEHDLIVNIISSNIENQADMQRYSLDLVLLKFSTGEYHPLARHPRIHVQKLPEALPWVIARIVGDNLALVIHSKYGTCFDKLLIFDWKTGRKVLQHETTRNAYLGLTFVSPELLLVTNSVLSHFEVWYLFPYHANPKPPIQILSLQIPTVSPGYSLRRFDCYGEPNPFLHDMPYLPPRPFFSSPENSVITATFRMSSNLSRDVSYDLIMHRRALLDTIQAWTSPSLLEHQELSTWLTNEVTVHKIADPEDGLVKLDVQSKLISTIPHPRSSPRTRDSPTSTTSQTFPASHISADSGSSSMSSGLSTNSSTSRCTFLRVPWAKWGPPISRWFQVNETHARWVNHSNGQRYAFSEPNPLERGKLMINVADFNQHNYRRNTEIIARLRSGEGGDNGSNGNNVEGKQEDEFEILDHEGVFSEEVYMGLKCVVYRAPDEYGFDLVLMDDERLLGVKLDRNGRKESVKALYIG